MTSPGTLSVNGNDADDGKDSAWDEGPPKRAALDHENQQERQGDGK
jgi:hypothetical protein